LKLSDRREVAVMLCQRCLKKIASYHSPKIVNNEIVHVHLCEDCVSRKNDHEVQNGFDDKLNAMFEGLVRTKEGDTGSSAEIQCEKCGTSLREYKKTHLLGCPACYDVFAKYFPKDLEVKKVAYAEEAHTDEMPDNLMHLRNELKRAVEEENFERAADLRDEIQKLERREAVRGTGEPRNGL
jgi:protein arginine kinase activator